VYNTGNKATPRGILHAQEQSPSSRTNARLAETVFRSPQLTLFDLGPDEWMAYWKAPSYALRRRRQPGSNMTQLVLFEVPVEEKAAGAETMSPFIRLVVSPQPEDEDS
jgi:hypothetical protein